MHIYVKGKKWMESWNNKRLYMLNHFALNM